VIQKVPGILSKKKEKGPLMNSL